LARAVFEATLRQAKAPLERLYSMAGEWASWKNYSNGDKDLWHLAWMIEGVNFTFVPCVADNIWCCSFMCHFCLRAVRC
jgi:hypothetical protein